MSYFFDQLANGLALGSVYALIALGFAMVYGVQKLLNFAHSEVFTAGAFLALFAERRLLALWPDRPVLVLLAAFACAGTGAGLLAMAIERIAYRPLRDRPKVMVLVAAIGISILLQNVGILALGAQTRGFPALPLPLSPRRLAWVVLGVAFVALYALIHRSSLGLRLRAVAEDRETAELMAIDPNRAVAAAFFLGGFLAGVAGVVWGAVYGTAHPQMGFYPGLKAFVIAVVGSIGSLPGTFLVGLGLGVVEALASAYLPSGVSALRDPLIFAALLAALAWKPAGLLGSAEPSKV